MLGEIDRDFYCVTNYLRQSSFGGSTKCYSVDNGGEICQYCLHRHRKHPTPEQFKEEYGREYPDDGAVYAVEDNIVDPKKKSWYTRSFFSAKHCAFQYVVCACTPYGKPDDNWRPE